MRRRPVTVALLLLPLVGATIVAATPATAGFPGTNGRLVFTSTQDGGQRHIFITSTYGITDLTGASTDATDTQPSFSADGNEIVFTRGAPGLPNTEIFVMSANGTGVVELTDTPTGNSDPTWSPDGRFIAFVSDRAGSPDIYVMRSDGTHVHALTHDTATESGLAWSPTGSTIAFVRTPAGGGDRDIYSIKTDGSGLTNLTNDPTAYDVSPDWSPDGQQIVYSAGGHPTGSVGGDLWIMNADGSNQTPLAHENNGYSDGGYPAWSPDGSTIAFAANNGSGYYHIWEVPAGGGENTAVVSNQGNGNPLDQEVDWQPGPTHVAAPDTTISGSTVSRKKHKAHFAFTSTGFAVGYQCALRKGSRQATFTTCHSPRAYGHLAKGRYLFKVRAFGPGGADTTPAKHAFRIR